MSMTGFLKVNGSLRGGRGDTRWFQLPGKSFSARSVRFGHHALVLDEMMRILPLGDGCLCLCRSFVCARHHKCLSSVEFVVGKKPNMAGNMFFKLRKMRWCIRMAFVPFVMKRS